MKKIGVLAIILSVWFGQQAMAETLSVISLGPGTTNFNTTGANTAAYPAWTYGGDSDVWQFDLTAFAPNTQISTSFIVQDAYLSHADDYNLYWDGSLLGNTGVGGAGVFGFDALAGLHTLEVEWLNPIPGGSWYHINIDIARGPALSTVPLPATLPLFGVGLGILVWVRRKQKIV